MIKRAIKDYTIITFGTILAAAAIYFFMLPSNLAVGSGTALAHTIYQAAERAKARVEEAEEGAH